MAKIKLVKPKAVSMFSGCGGMDLGLTQAGYEVVWANDIKPDACETYRNNIGPIIQGDINDLDAPKFKNIDLLAAGFPCQPFSNAGSRNGTRDTRGTLYQATFRFIEKLNPKVVIYENVRGILSIQGKKHKLIDEIAETLRKQYGYYVAYRLLNFSHFGVPQNRIRVVLVALRDEQYLEHAFPEVVAGKDLSIETTLGGLDENIPNQMELMKLNPQALHYGAMIPEGGSWKDLPYEVYPNVGKKFATIWQGITTRSSFAASRDMKSAELLQLHSNQKTRRYGTLLRTEFSQYGRSHDFKPSPMILFFLAQVLNQNMSKSAMLFRL